MEFKSSQVTKDITTWDPSTGLNSINEEEVVKII